MPDVPHQTLSEIGGYTVVEVLTPDQTWLATAPGGAGGRRVVLKALDADCLWKNQLHPSIRDRLGRVRELAHTGVASLHGVERAGGLVYAVWEFVPGQTLDRFAASPACDRPALIGVARELMLALEMLHARGIVHGAIKASNVVVDPDTRRVVLTHVSPFLYGEPDEDMRAASGMLGEIVERRGEAGTPLARLLESPPARRLSPRQFAAKLGAPTRAEPADAPPPLAPADADADRREPDRIRRRALLGAAATALLAVALFAGLKIYADRNTPAPPAPAEADPAALRSEPAAAGHGQP